VGRFAASPACETPLRGAGALRVKRTRRGLSYDDLVARPSTGVAQGVVHAGALDDLCR